MSETPDSSQPLIGATTTVAGQTADDGRARIFPCEGCGADLEFHIGQQRLKCPFCGFEKEIELSTDAVIQEQDFEAALAKGAVRKQRASSGDAEQHELTCESCSGTVLFTGTLTSSRCPYCGSPIQRDRVHVAAQRIPADGVLPFQIDHDRAAAALSQWVSSRWFAPNEFLRRGVSGEFEGVYLPYWTYDAMTFTAYSGKRGEDYWVTRGSGKNKRRVRKTRWYPASGSFQRFFDDVLVSGTRGFPNGRLLALEPWPLAKCLPFNQQVLAGHFARTYDIELPDGFQEAKGRIEEALTADVRDRIGGDRQRIHSIDTRYDALTFKHLLLPVWLLAYRYQDNPYQVFINAATGEVHGDRPYSWVKILLAVLAVLLIAGIVAAFSSR